MDTPAGAWGAAMTSQTTDPANLLAQILDYANRANPYPLFAELRKTPVVRAPNGVVQDGAEFFGAGKPYYDPSKITAPTLLIGAEWDRDTPPYMAQTLFPLLVNSPGKRYVALAEGTHTIIMERNRLKLFEAVQAFLDEAKRS